MKISDDFQMDEGILELEVRIGVSKYFFRDLKDADDWSFIIKLHALFEAACTHLLLFHFKEPNLTGLFSRLELSNKTIGKTAFLGKIGLLEKENRSFISSLSEIRNSLVHDVRNSQFSLPDMVTGLEASVIKRMAISFSPFETRIRKFSYSPEMKVGFDKDLQDQASVSKIIDRFITNPKFHIWIGAYSALVTIVEMYEYSDYMQWVKAKKHFGDD